MDRLTFPLILVALGGVVLVLARHNRLALGALLAQWLGLAWVIASLTPATSRPVLGLSALSAVELVTAGVSTGILWITLRGFRPSAQPAHPSSDYLLPSAALLMAGVAGVGFANLFPLGAGPELDLVLYWTALTGALALILEGSRSPVKLAAGLLVLLNATALLIYILGDTAPTAALLGLLSASRVALAVLMAYLWLLLIFEYGDLSLDPLFISRDADSGATVALAVVANDERWAFDPGLAKDGRPVADDGRTRPDVEEAREDDEEGTMNDGETEAEERVGTAGKGVGDE